MCEIKKSAFRSEIQELEEIPPNLMASTGVKRLTLIKVRLRDMIFKEIARFKARIRRLQNYEMEEPNLQSPISKGKRVVNI